MDATEAAATPEQATSYDALHKSEACGALVMAARSLQKKGREQEARRKLQEALTLQPGDCFALELLGELYLEEGEQEKAIEVFRRGLALHPRHRSFEDKIALALLDLQEVQRDNLLREQMRAGELTLGLTRPEKAKFGALLHLLPGAQHFMADDGDRGAWFLGAWFLTLVGWAAPLNWGYYLAANDPTVHRHSLANALAELHGFWEFWMATMLVAFVGTYIASLVDVANNQARAEAERKHVLGV